MPAPWNHEEALAKGSFVPQISDRIGQFSHLSEGLSLELCVCLSEPLKGSPVPGRGALLSLTFPLAGPALNRTQRTYELKDKARPEVGVRRVQRHTCAETHRVRRGIYRV